MISKINLVLNVVTLFAVLILAWFFYLDHKRIVYVDASKLVNSYKGMQEARTAYEQKTAVWNANVDTLGKEVQDEILRYQSEQKTMSVKEREQRQILIKSKQRQLSEYQQAVATKAQQEDENLSKQVINEINVVVRSYGKKHGYQIILAATEYGNIGYGVDELDITDEILAELNSSHAKTRK